MTHLPPLKDVLIHGRHTEQGEKVAKAVRKKLIEKGFKLPNLKKQSFAGETAHFEKIEKS